MAPAVSLSRLSGVLILLTAAGTPAAGQATRAVSVEAGVAQSVVRGHGDFRGPGLLVSFVVPRTHNVDAGIEAGFFFLGDQRTEFTRNDPVFGTVITTNRSKQEIGWLALVARHHTGATPARLVLTATAGVWGMHQLRGFQERTPTGARTAAGVGNVTSTDLAPGLSVGVGVLAPLGAALRLSAQARLHGAFLNGLPVLTLSAGVAYR